MNIKLNKHKFLQKSTVKINKYCLDILKSLSCSLNNIYGKNKKIAKDVDYKDIAFLDDNNPNDISEINMFKNLINHYKLY